MNKIIPGREARQGRSGRRILIVLLSALVLALIVWIGVEVYGQFLEASPPV
jgi:hypothetical protein